MSLRPYTVQLSNKQEVKITSDELDIIGQGVQTGSIIKLRRAIINPSFIVAIVPDVDTWNAHMYVTGIEDSPEWHEKKQLKRDEGVPIYKDAFSIDLKDIKKLTESKKMGR